MSKKRWVCWNFRRFCKIPIITRNTLFVRVLGITKFIIIDQTNTAESESLCDFWSIYSYDWLRDE